MLQVFRSNRAEPLVDGLAQRLASDPPADPFEPVQVAVPSRGIERWVAHRLSERLGAGSGEAGICANIAFPFPRKIVGQALTVALDETAEDDPWAPERLAWPLLELLSDLPDEPLWAPLRHHLGIDARAASRRRYPLARRVADLFDRYAVYRGKMLLRWMQGADEGPEGKRLPAEHAWQAELWRRTRALMPVPSRAERHERALRILDGRDATNEEALRGRLRETLPTRVELFGVVALPPVQLELLAALGRHVDVTLNVVAPCRSWRLGSEPEASRHPLLASDGAATRDFHTILAEHIPTSEDADGDRTRDWFVDPAAAAGQPPSLLARLQSDVLADRPPRPPGERPAVEPGDQSVQVHACHGPTRQLEVLRDVLYGLLEDDRSLQPRDVVVLTPDITAYDPLITAVFSDGDVAPGSSRTGAGEGRAGVPALPFRVADRTLLDDNPVATALVRVLDLVGGRVTGSAVLDFLTSDPVRRRFDLTDSDLERIPVWLHGTGVCWGMDGDHRDALIGLPDGTHTWDFGLNRLALGAAMADDGDRIVGGVVPYDHVEGSAVELAGRLAAATDALFAHLRGLADPRPIAQWGAALEAAVADLFEAERDETWQVEQVRDAIAGVVADSEGADGSPSTVPLTLEETRAALGASLEALPSAARYGTGAITFCGLVPLRNIPHRVVCLVGMDDAALPRPSSRPGFDLVASQPRQPGDPDPRIEDRQLLLDAILAARERLIITYTGQDPRTNEPRQPAVPVSELLDCLDESASVDVGGSVRQHVTVRHPLQAHSPRNFGEGGPPRSFDRRHLAAAEALCADPVEPTPFFPGPLPPPDETELDPVVVELSDLLRFLDHPVRFLLTRRLGLALGGRLERPSDRDPTELDPLGRAQVGGDLLRRRLTGEPADTWRRVTLACGIVPVGGLGEVALDEVDHLVEELCAEAEQTVGPKRQLAVDAAVTLPDGRHRRIVGSVEVVGSTVLHVRVSKLAGKHRLTTWARFLAATAAEPDREVTSRLLGRGTGTIDRASYRPLATWPASGDSAPPAPGEIAGRLLGQLVALYERGHRQPVPLFPATSEAYARALAKGGDERTALRRAADKWRNERLRFGDGYDDYNAQVLGSGCEIERVHAETDFAEVAQTVWEPVIAMEEAS